MKAMFRLVAIIALIATIGGEVPQYSEKALKDLELTNEYSAYVEAEVINPGVKIEFKEEPEDNVLDAVYLVPATKPEFESSKDCGGALGIKLPDMEIIYCNINHFDIIVEKDMFKPAADTLELSLTFGSESKEAHPLILYVPIFIQPSKYAEANKQTELKKWAAYTEVGIHFPDEAIDDIRNKKNPKLSFEWLSDLLRFHITVLETPSHEWRGWNVRPVGFLARPIVLPKNVVEELVSLGNQKPEVNLNDTK